MSKKNVMITIDPEVHKLAQDQMLNLSGEVEAFLKKRLIYQKKDLPQELIFIKCSVCRKEIEEGFLCREGKKVICIKCHNKWDFVRNCGKYHDDDMGRMVHYHIKFPGFKNNNVEYVKEAEKASQRA